MTELVITKPLLNVEQQVEHLKEKGIKFNIMSEEEAKEYLTKNNYYYKLTSYKKIIVKILKACILI